jgi:serine/threonine protein phosphatase PrpC
MELSYCDFTWKGPVREKNEDTIAFRKPPTQQEWRGRGAVAIIADGVGGHGNGDVASQLAVSKALEVYEQAPLGLSPVALLRQMFNAANLAVYDASVEAQGSDKRMATTMTAVLLRRDQVHVAHVGDCRVYHIHRREITRITTDHSYTGMQMKLGLINAHEAAASELRCLLTRSIGKDPTVQVDFHTVSVNPGEFIVLCCDGVHAAVSEQELAEIVRQNPGQACSKLRDLCERRGAEDNLSIQIIHVHQVERLTIYRGMSVYQTETDPHAGQELQVDQILDGRYQIVDQISKSGMATIYRAIDLKTGTSVALKVPFMQFESDPAFYSRFQREEEIGQKLRHPYIIRIENPEGLEKSRPYLVMEYLQGQTLGHLMRSVRPLPESDALKIASRVCDALAYLHENDVVHRDLKPDNIMICDDGSIRLMDFGIAKQEGARRLTFGKFQPAMGTPDYMAPEQVRGQRGDARTDIYALGAILYEMLTGFPPFDGANPLVIMNSRLSGDPVAPRARNPKLSKAAEEIVLHAMARKPEERYQAAMDMRRDLDYPMEVQITGRVDRLQPVKPFKTGLRRFSMFLVAAAVVVVFLIVLLLTKIRIHVEVK